MRRWQRVLVCLLLVCCILVNLSPLRADATAGTVATAVTLAVGIPVAVAVGLNALGVRQGSSSTDFNQVVNDCVDTLSPSWAVNGLNTMLSARGHSCQESERQRCSRIQLSFSDGGTESGFHWPLRL